MAYRRMFTLALFMVLSVQVFADNKMRIMEMKQEFLRAHNNVRDAVGVPPLTWNPKISHYASLFARLQRDHAHCKMKNSGTDKFGENVCWAKGRPISATDAVMAWAAEKKAYDYNSNRCVNGTDERCGVYTQMVWKNTTQLGCALVSCDHKDVTLVICNYFPPGNIVGLKPY